MGLSRRNFFKGLCAVAGLAGAGVLLGAKKSSAFKDSPVGRKEVGVEWLGHGSFVFTSCKGLRILLDPWISTNPKCPGKYKLKKAFGKVDLVLWTHGHVDHFMLPDAKAVIAEYSPKVVAPWELNFFIKSQIPEAQTQTFKLGNKGTWADFSGLSIAMVHAEHSSGAQLTGFEGTNRYVGEAVGYVIRFENGLVLYHSGDTALFGDMDFVVKRQYRPHVAILPTGGVFTMGSKEAVVAVETIGPQVAIPEHYGTFPVLEQSPEEFRRLVAEKCPGVECLCLEPGKPVKI
ncbi:MAG: metal-dependent hydrolase [Desulfovibrionaceae bacterium]|nr:metal-dependent hydrolase [Desulfovibrionaceae bacterium]MDD4952386.1 metal-dependent hydrolase [Desulfovibrionaceae bacterium]